MKYVLLVVFCLASSLPKSFAQCDTTKHNYIKGMDFRDPTECEAQLDAKIRKAIATAFNPVKNIPGWIVQNETGTQTISSVRVDSVKDFYRYDHTDVGGYHLDLQMDPGSAEYAKWLDQYNAMKNGIKNPTPEQTQSLNDFLYKMRCATTIHIFVSVNDHKNDALVFKGGHKPFASTGIAYGVRAANVQALSGGDINQSTDATLLYVGNYTAPVSTQNADGSELIAGQPQFKKGAILLSVQNIYIRIEANEEMAKKVIMKLNLLELKNILS